MSKLWELQLTNTLYLQISPFDYRSENLRHLSEHSSNFRDARRITTENAFFIFIYSETKLLKRLTQLLLDKLY